MSEPTETSPVEPDPAIAWMQRIREGDTGAFRELIECHQNRVIGTIARMLGDDRDAEDLAQQVFLRVWKSAGRYRPEAKFTTWLYTITRNLVFNESRRRKRHPVQSYDACEFPVEYPDTASTPDVAALETELQDAIAAAIQALPETQRMAVVLRRYEDLSYEEIAAVLKTSVSSVKSLLFRARTELRRSLAAYLEE